MATFGLHSMIRAFNNGHPQNPDRPPQATIPPCAALLPAVSSVLSRGHHDSGGHEVNRVRRIVGLGIAGDSESNILFLMDDVGNAGRPLADRAPGSVLPVGDAGGNKLTLTQAVILNPLCTGNELFYLAVRNNTQDSRGPDLGSVVAP
jgi:hypothetical protein